MWSVETRSRVGYDLIISNLIWNGFIKQFSPPRPALLTHVIRCSSAQDKAYKHLFLVHWSCCRINISISVYCAGLVVMLQPSPWCFVAIRDWIVQTTAQYQWSDREKLGRGGEKAGTRQAENGLYTIIQTCSEYHKQRYEVFVLQRQILLKILV